MFAKAYSLSDVMFILTSGYDSTKYTLVNIYAWNHTTKQAVNYMSLNDCMFAECKLKNPNPYKKSFRVLQRGASITISASYVDAPFVRIQKKVEEMKKVSDSSSSNKKEEEYEQLTFF